MKAVWLANVATQMVDSIINENKRSFFGGGWLDGLSERLLKNKDFELVYCYPLYTQKENLEGSRDNFKFYGFAADGKKLRKGVAGYETFEPYFEEILKKESPDIIHIHGTEFEYCYSMCRVAERLNMIDRVVISIQGLVGVYANHLFAGMSAFDVRKCTIKELLTQNSIYDTYKAYVRRGVFENKSIEMVHHVMGRTEWDKACVALVNPNCVYHFSNETLRAPFYEGTWKYSECTPHTIFASQALLPLKGLHILLKAVAMIKDDYKDLKIEIAGQNIIDGDWISGSSYGMYIKKLIQKYGLQDNVVFLGPQNAIQMKEHMLKCNVFVSPSTIENSPNSVGEAMLLGVPCISSDVGGVTNMMNANDEGYIYPHDEHYMLAHYIKKVFDEKDAIAEMTCNAQRHARVTHNPNENSFGVMEIYKNIIHNL